MDTKELSRLTKAYDTAVIKYLNIRDELKMKRLLLAGNTSLSTVGLPSSEEKEAFKAVKEGLDKASTAYFAAMKEYRTELLPKGYREVEMQGEVTYDELCSDEDLEEEENTPKASIAAIPEQAKELPYYYKHVTPVSTKGEIKASTGMLVWNWIKESWISWKESEDFCNFTEIAES